MIPLDAVRRALSSLYRLERELGSGGMATVYLADDLRHGRKVAVKVLHPEVAAVVGVDRFLREIQVTAGLHHPHILPLHDSGSFAVGAGTRLPYYVSPVVEGESLRDRLQRERRLPVDEAVRITTQVAGALAYAHGRGVIHRDIKPDNILLHHGLALLADFGIALETGAKADRLTTVGLTVGTVSYMSPEQASGERGLDGRSDQYSLAAVLFEMLAGEPPFAGPNPRAVLARQLTEPPPSVRRLRPEVPEGLDRIVAHALEAEPSARFQDAGTFAAALLGEVPAPRAARRGGRRLALAALAVLVVVAAAWGVYGRTRAAPDGGEAGDLTRRGWIQLDRRTVEGTSRAVALFRSAIARDSAFADAWAGLALALQYATIRQYPVDGVPRDSIAPLTIQASARAIDADSTNARAWVARTYALRLIEPGSRANMIAAGERAVRLDARSVDAWHYLGLAREEHLEPGLAREAYARAVALVPGHLRTLYFLGLHFMWARQYDSALVWADSTVRVDPTYLNGRQTRGIIYLLQGKLDQAEEDFRASLPLGATVDQVPTWTGLAAVALLRGRTQAAAQLVDTAVAAADTVKPTLHDAAYLGWAFAALGQHDRALRTLERFAVRRDRHFQLHLKKDPQLDPLRSDPRFQALLVPDE
jgi:tetratricopeptide (TPR) repeat protein